MSEPAAILATFAGFKQPVIGRRVVPLVFEVPIEQFQDALKALGTPDAANPVWCGIARTNLKVSGPVASSQQGPEREGDRAQYVAAPSHDISPVQGEKGDGGGSERPSPSPNIRRAMALARDPEFWSYLVNKFGMVIEGRADVAEAAIKSHCGIVSKTELNDGRGAAAFGRLWDDFNAWRQARAHGAA